MHDKAPQVVLVLRAVEDPKTGEVNEALQVARLLLFASIDRAGLHHVTYPGRDGAEYLGLSADEMRLIKEADRLGVEMRLGRTSQHPAIEVNRLRDSPLTVHRTPFTAHRSRSPLTTTGEPPRQDDVASARTDRRRRVRRGQRERRAHHGEAVPGRGAQEAVGLLLWRRI